MKVPARYFPIQMDKETSLIPYLMLRSYCFQPESIEFLYKDNEMFIYKLKSKSFPEEFLVKVNIYVWDSVVFEPCEPKILL